MDIRKKITFPSLCLIDKNNKQAKNEIQDLLTHGKTVKDRNIELTYKKSMRKKRKFSLIVLSF